MELEIVLAILFVAFTAVFWAVMSVSERGYHRYEAVFTERADSKLETMFLFFDARKIFFINVIGLLVVPLVVYLLTGILFYAGLAVVVVLLFPKIVFRVLEAKRKNAIRDALPDCLVQIAGGMRAGSTFITSVETMVRETPGPIGQEFSLLLREQKLGMTLSEALDNLAERVQLEEMDLVVTAAQIAREVGGNLADIFERLSTTLRRKLEMEGKIRALTSQGKMQGWVVGLLPFAIIFALMFVEPEGVGPIFTSLLGWMFLAVIVVLEILGGLMIRKIVSIDV